MEASSMLDKSFCPTSDKWLWTTTSICSWPNRFIPFCTRSLIGIMPRRAWSASAWVAWFEAKKRPRSAALGRSGLTEDVEDEDLCVRVTVDDRVEFVFGDHHVGDPIIFVDWDLQIIYLLLGLCKRLRIMRAKRDNYRHIYACFHGLFCPLLSTKSHLGPLNPHINIIMYLINSLSRIRIWRITKTEWLILYSSIDALKICFRTSTDTKVNPLLRLYMDTSAKMAKIAQESLRFLACRYTEMKARLV